MAFRQIGSNMLTVSDSRQGRVMPFSGIRLMIGFFSSLVAIYLFLCPPAKGQIPRGQGRQATEQKLSNLTVEVRMPNGTPLDLGAIVNLYKFGHISEGIGSVTGGRAEFHNLAPGSYTVEVIAPGYEKLTETVDIQVTGQNERVLVTLTPVSASSENNSPPGPPVLAPNAQKEFNKALEAIRENKPGEARKHLEKVSRAAPSNPDVNYLWGAYYSRINNWTLAKSYWEKALQISPRHVFSLSALGQCALQEGDMPAAIRYLGLAVEADPSSWRYQEYLANAFLQHKEYQPAQAHAERAVELGKDRANGARLILAQALLQRNDLQRAITTLETILAAQPPDLRAAEARRLLDALQHAAPASTAVQTASTFASPISSATTIAEELIPPPKWMPPDVDENMPAVEPGVACPLQEIQDETAKRVREFIDAANRIAATEKLENEVLNRSGFPAVRESRTFEYVASITEIRPGILDVEEYRNGAMDPEVFPQHIATLGLPTLVLIFHPFYKDDYEVKCEGLSRRRAGLAWQVHFRQKPDKPSRLRGYRVGRNLNPVSLRGRAWIATDSFQVLSLETDIVSPIPQIRLKAEHVSVDYAAVIFRKDNQKLWLPENAELFFDFGGHRMHRRHHFSNYLLFSVDEKEKISAPKIDTGADPSPPAP
jgi:Flp pilus assembly protein TadD